MSFGAAAQFMREASRARLRRRHRPLDVGGIALHHRVEFAGLARQLLQRLVQFRVACLQRAVDAEVGGFQRVGRPHDRLALVFKAIGHAADLRQQIFRYAAQHVGLSRQSLDGLDRLLGDILARPSHRIDAVHQRFVDVGGLPSKRVRQLPRVCFHCCRQRERLLADDAVDRRRRAHDGFIEQPYAFGKRAVERARPLDQRRIEFLRALRQCLIECLGILVEHGLHFRSAIAECGIDGTGIFVEHLLEMPGPVGQRPLDLVRGDRQRSLELVGRLQQRALERDQVLPGAFDDARQFALLSVELFDQRGHLVAHRAQRRVHVGRG